MGKKRCTKGGRATKQRSQLVSTGKKRGKTEGRATRQQSQLVLTDEVAEMTVPHNVTTKKRPHSTASKNKRVNLTEINDVMLNTPPTTDARSAALRHAFGVCFRGPQTWDAETTGENIIVGVPDLNRPRFAFEKLAISQSQFKKQMRKLRRNDGNVETLHFGSGRPPCYDAKSLRDGAQAEINLKLKGEETSTEQAFFNMAAASTNARRGLGGQIKPSKATKAGRQALRKRKGPAKSTQKKHKKWLKMELGVGFHKVQALPGARAEAYRDPRNPATRIAVLKSAFELTGNHVIGPDNYFTFDPTGRPVSRLDCNDLTVHK